MANIVRHYFPGALRSESDRSARCVFDHATGIASTTSQNFALLNVALLSESAAEQFTGRHVA
jgi:hypothetical protein